MVQWYIGVLGGNWWLGPMVPSVPPPKNGEGLQFQYARYYSTNLPPYITWKEVKCKILDETRHLFLKYKSLVNNPQSLRLLSLCGFLNAEARPSAFLNLWGTMLLQFIFSVYVDLGSSVKFTLQGLIGTFLAYLSLGTFSGCRKTGGQIEML